MPYIAETLRTVETDELLLALTLPTLPLVFRIPAGSFPRIESVRLWLAELPRTLDNTPEALADREGELIWSRTAFGRPPFMFSASLEASLSRTWYTVVVVV